MHRSHPAAPQAATSTVATTTYESVTDAGQHCTTASELPTTQNALEWNNNGVVYWGSDYPVTPTADFATWKYCNDSNDTIFAKDKNYVWLDLKTLPEADPATFVMVGVERTDTEDGSTQRSADYYYAKDATHVWYTGGAYSGDTASLIAGADASTFRETQSVDAGPLGEDKSHVYFRSSMVPDADPNTFSIISDPNSTQTVYAKDAAHVWLLDWHYTDSAGQVFSPIQGADPATFAYVGEMDSCEGGCPIPHIAKDANHVYLDGKVSPDVDAATYTYLSPAYQKDKNHVYLDGAVLAGADPATFEAVEVVGLSFIGKDANHIYNEGKPVDIAGLDVATFQGIPDADGHYVGYDKDANHVYWDVFWKGGVVAGADPASFVLVPEVTATTTNKKGKVITNMVAPLVNGQDVDAKDSSHYYWKGEVIQ